MLAPLHFFLAPQWPPHFFNPRIATGNTPRGSYVSSASKNFVREGPVADVVLNPTVPSIHFVTVGN